MIWVFIVFVVNAAVMIWRPALRRERTNEDDGEGGIIRNAGAVVYGFHARQDVY